MKKFPYSPLGSIVVLEPFEEGDMIGRLFIPSTAKRPLNQGRIVSIGPNVSESIFIGGIVLFAMHMESQVTIDRDKWLLIEEQHIQCIAKEEDVLKKEIILK